MSKEDDFRFGMVGHGHISGQFLAAIEVVDGAYVGAVAGRDGGRASAFAQEQGIAAAYGSVGEMLDAEQLDAVYICTPHPSHAEAALACIEAGMAVLVENPMAPSLAGASRIVDAARDAGVFAMEAMWTRFLPIYEVVRRWVDDGRIGDVQLVRAAVWLRRSGDARASAVRPESGGREPARRGGVPIDRRLLALRFPTLRSTGWSAGWAKPVWNEIVSITASYPGGRAGPAQQRHRGQPRLQRHDLRLRRVDRDPGLLRRRPGHPASRG